MSTCGSRCVWRVAVIRCAARNPTVGGALETLLSKAAHRKTARCPPPLMHLGSSSARCASGLRFWMSARPGTVPAHPRIPGSSPARRRGPEFAFRPSMGLWVCPASIGVIPGSGFGHRRDLGFAFRPSAGSRVRFPAINTSRVRLLAIGGIQGSSPGHRRNPGFAFRPSTQCGFASWTFKSRKRPWMTTTRTLVARMDKARTLVARMDRIRTLVDRMATTRTRFARTDEARTLVAQTAARTPVDRMDTTRPPSRQQARSPPRQQENADRQHPLPVAKRPKPESTLRKRTQPTSSSRKQTQPESVLRK